MLRQNLILFLIFFSFSGFAEKDPKKNKEYKVSLKNNKNSNYLLTAKALNNFKINIDAPVKLKFKDKNLKNFSKKDFKLAKDKKSVFINLDFSKSSKNNRPKSGEFTFYICSPKICRKIKEEVRF